uniref:FAS1 domain-containing protein n=1 Tax=Kalanchoe fedtschenkoi TaxID=63787 RepID=A0A7N0TEE4_KALFE
MGFNMFSMVSFTVLVVCSPITFGQTAPPTSSPTPAPAPAPVYVNLTDLLTVAGPFSIFLSYLEKTGVIDTFQNQANNTEEGITIFVPKNSAFSSQKNPSLANLTSDQLKQLCLFHALPHYYSLADFKNLSLVSPVGTFAGNTLYALNFTDDSGTVKINSGWTKTEVSSSVHSTDPVAVYQVNKVLLPEAIFGTDIPPTAAPAPAPDAPAADSPAAPSDKGTTPSGKPSNSSFKSASWDVMTQLILAISGLIMLFL